MDDYDTLCPRSSDPFYIGSYHIKRVSTSLAYTVCPRSSDLFYIVTYYIKWVTTSWTHSTYTSGVNIGSLYNRTFILILRLHHESLSMDFPYYSYCMPGTFHFHKKKFLILRFGLLSRSICLSVFLVVCSDNVQYKCVV